MKIPVRISPRAGLWLAVAVILISNALALIHVAWNRSGKPQVVTLTNRELAPPYPYWQNSENSGLTLRMRYNVAGSAANGVVTPSAYASMKLGPGRLESFGYPPEPECTAGVLVTPNRSREAWVVLEYAGAAYHEDMARLEKHVAEVRKEAGANPDKAQQRKVELAVSMLARHQEQDSRLYAIDASPNEATLKADYAGKPGTWLVMPAIVRPMQRCNKPTGLYVSELLTGTVNVPVNARSFFYGEREVRSPVHLQQLKYSVTIALGKFAEPWFVKIDALKE